MENVSFCALNQASSVSNFSENEDLGDELLHRAGYNDENDEDQLGSYNDDPADDIEEVWENSDGELEAKNAQLNVVDHSDTHMMIKVVSFFFLIWQRCYGVSGIAIVVLLKFFKQTLLMLADKSGSDVIRSLAEFFPVSLAKVKEIVGIGGVDFTIYVMCPKCSAIYAKEGCSKKLPDGRVVSKTCSNVLWPQHPHRSRRLPCGEKLLKKVRGKNGNTFWYPRKVYTYQSITKTLNNFFQKETFTEHCEKWRNSAPTNGDMHDIYDGKVWKEFYIYKGKPFLKEPNNLALILNVDWFNPYKHAPGSIGAIYCVIANLPREERYKRENIILIGLIEGEPKHDMNSVLKPIVDEFLKLWNGVWIGDGLLNRVFVRAALLCVACDIPAARKVAGFMGHNATFGCSRCSKRFPVASFGEKPDFSGFNRNSWPKRNAEEHRSTAMNTLGAKTPSELARLESESGARYTELWKLPY